MFTIETILNVWFTIELALRFLTCSAKFDFIKNWLNIIDVVAILPYYFMLSASSAALGAELPGLIRITDVFRRNNKLWLNPQNLSTDTHRTSGEIVKLFQVFCSNSSDDTQLFIAKKRKYVFQIIANSGNNSLPLNANVDSISNNSTVTGAMLCSYDFFL